MEDYIKKVIRTESGDFEEISKKLSTTVIIRLLHAAMGINTESGELTDMLKRYIFYGAPIDRVNAIEELGDIMWYIGIACHALNTTIEELMETNISKLKIRYPEKFSKLNALDRDLENEHIILEGEEK